MSFLSTLAKTLLTFLFPRSEKMLALEKLPPEKLLNLLPKSRLDEKDTFALFSYQDPLVKELVWDLKYKGNRTLAETFGTLLCDTILSELGEHNVFEKHPEVLLMPIPISDRRRMERGWNQAELLAKAVRAADPSQRFSYLRNVLLKTHHTESQTRTHSKQERLENLQNSMTVSDPEKVSGRCVILIDDVTTTGATFREAKRTLHLAGVRFVLCFALAH